jgi:Uma2 family endonuclease
VLSPDASWVDAISWNALPKAAREGYPPLCPRIVFEILSPTDSVHELRQKLATFLENGVAVGILLNPRTRAAERFETGMPIVTIAANEVLVIEKRFFPGATDDFKLDLAELFGV